MELCSEIYFKSCQCELFRFSDLIVPHGTKLNDENVKEKSITSGILLLIITFLHSTSIVSKLERERDCFYVS